MEETLKRSDMIERIVYEALSWNGLDTSGVPLKEIADDMLKVIEASGMLVPFYNVRRVEPGGIQKTLGWEPETSETAKSLLKVMKDADMLNPFHTQKPGYNKK